MEPFKVTPEILAFANSSVLCWLATATRDGQPNVSPKEIFTFVGDRLVIANIKSPKSVRNIRENAHACVAFIDVFVQKGFQLYGSAKLLNRDAPDFPDYHSQLSKIAGPDFPFNTLFEITPDSAKPIVSPRYVLFPETSEEEQIRSARKQYGFDQRNRD